MHAAPRYTSTAQALDWHGFGARHEFQLMADPLPVPESFDFFADPSKETTMEPATFLKLILVFDTVLCVAHAVLSIWLGVATPGSIAFAVMTIVVNSFLHLGGR